MPACLRVCVCITFTVKWSLNLKYLCPSVGLTFSVRVYLEAKGGFSFGSKPFKLLFAFRYLRLCRTQEFSSRLALRRQSRLGTVQSLSSSEPALDVYEGAACGKGLLRESQVYCPSFAVLHWMCASSSHCQRSIVICKLSGRHEPFNSFANIVCGSVTSWTYALY